MKTDTPSRGREYAKSERRSRILVAARELLREGGEEKLSMKALASRASVSLMTPYNLIGSKEDIIRSVIEEDARLGEERIGSRSVGGLDELLLIVPDSARLLERQADYVRAILIALGRAGSGATRQRWMEPQLRWWEKLVEKAINEGDLRPDIRTDILVSAMQDVLSGMLYEWAGGYIDIAGFEARCGYGFVLLLIGAATEKRVTELKSRLAETPLKMQQKMA